MCSGEIKPKKQGESYICRGVDKNGFGFKNSAALKTIITFCLFVAGEWVGQAGEGRQNGFVSPFLKMFPLVRRRIGKVAQLEEAAMPWPVLGPVVFKALAQLAISCLTLPDI